MNTLYTTQVTAVGGRNGKISSHDGVLNLEVRSPKEIGGSGGPYSNPEQLFAAGYAACFDGALNLAARQDKIRVGKTRVTATVSFLAGGPADFGLAVDLEIDVPGLEPEVALDLIQKAHHICPYSRAVEGNIRVSLRLAGSSEGA